MRTTGGKGGVAKLFNSFFELHSELAGGDVGGISIPAEQGRKTKDGQQHKAAEFLQYNQEDPVVSVTGKNQRECREGYQTQPTGV